MEQTLYLGHRPKSLNQTLSASHWTRRQVKREVQEEVYWACKEQKIKPITGPVALDVFMVFKNKRRRDLDNFTSGLKPVLDGLRYAGILIDDNSEVVTAINLRLLQGVRDGVVIRFRDADPLPDPQAQELANGSPVLAKSKPPKPR